MSPTTDRIALVPSVCPACGCVIEPGSATRMVQSEVTGYRLAEHRTCRTTARRA